MRKSEFNLFEKVTDIYIAVIIILFPLIVDSTGFFKILECKYKAFLEISLLYIIINIILYIYYILVKKVNVLNGKKINKVQVCAIIFWIVNVISCIFSPYKGMVNLFIGVGRGEGLINITLYVLTFLIITTFGKFNKKQIIYFSISSILLNFIAILQFIGFNPFNMYQNGIGTHNVSFMTTIGNVDFISALYCILLSISAFAYIYMDEKKICKYIHLLSVGMGSFIFNIIDVNSGKVAFLGIVVLAFPFIVTCSKRLKKSLNIVNIIMIANCINVIMNTEYHYDIGKIVLNFQINYIVILFFVVIVILAILSKILNKIDYDISSNKKIIRNIYLVYLIVALLIIIFLYFIDLKFGMLSEIHNILHGNLKDEYGTYRIFLWKRTIKLIQEYPLLGSGSDTFAVRFMSRFSNDVVALGEYSINDTAANVYLTMLINIGIIGLASYLLFIYTLIKNSVTNTNGKNLIEDNKETMVLLSAVVCYLIQDIFNLWVVIITPVFWTTLALLKISKNNEN